MVLSGSISAILGFYFCRRPLQGKLAWRHLAVNTGKETLVVRGKGLERASFMMVGGILGDF